MNVSHAPPATALPEAPVRAEPERRRGASGGVGNAARAERLAQRMAPADPPPGGGGAAPPAAPPELQRAIHGIRDQAAAIQGVHVEMAAERGAVDDVAEAAAGAGEAMRGLASRVTSWVAPTPQYADASVRMPPTTIWDPVFAALAEADRAIAAGSVRAAGDHVRAAVGAFRSAARRYREYRDRVGAGAESATTALQIVEGLGAMAGGALLAPVIASAAGVTSTSLVTGALLNGAGAVATRAVLVGAAEGSRRALGEEGPSAGALLGQVMQEGVTAVVSSLFGGFLSARMARALVARAGVRLPAAEGQLLLSSSEHVLVDLLSGIGTAPIQAAVHRVMRRVTGTPDPRTFAEEVADEVISGAMGGMFFGALMRRLQGMRLGVREPGERTAIAPPEPAAGAAQPHGAARPAPATRTVAPGPAAPTAPGPGTPARAGVGAVETTPRPPPARAGVGAVETTPRPASASAVEATPPRARAGVGAVETTPRPPPARAGVGGVETTPRPASAAAVEATPPRARAGVGAVETTGRPPPARAGAGEVETTGRPAATVGGELAALPPPPALDVTHHLHEVARYQRLVVARIPGVPRGTMVVPDWHPGPLRDYHIRLSELKQFLRMVAAVRQGGEADLWVEMVSTRQLTREPGVGSNSTIDDVNLDPNHGGNAIARATTAVHEGGHVARGNAGRQPDASRMGLGAYLQAAYEEEAAVHARALRFAARLVRRNGGDVSQIREEGASEYFTAYETARRFGATEQRAQEIGEAALVLIWPRLRTSGVGRPTYQEHYTGEWNRQNPGRLP